MARKCSAGLIEGFKLEDEKIMGIYESMIREWSNGGAYVPIPKGLGKKKVYVIVRK